MSDDESHYEYIASHVDDLMIASKNPMKYIDKLKNNYPLRNVEQDPEFYLGNNIKTRDDNTIKIGLEKYVKEVIRRFEKNMTHSAKKTYHIPQMITRNQTIRHYSTKRE